MVTYVLLMRHGARNRDSSKPEALSDAGSAQTKEVADALAEMLEEVKGDDLYEISLTEIWRGHAPEVGATERIVDEALRKHGGLCTTSVKNELDPENFQPYSNAGLDTTLRDKLLNAPVPTESRGCGSPAILVIGQQPLLGWLAYQLVHEQVPIDRSELACIELADSWWKARSLWRRRLRVVFSWRWPLVSVRDGVLRWVISPTDDAALADIREKIRSKMEVAKLLSVFIIAAFGIALGTLFKTPSSSGTGSHWALNASAGVLMLSIILYLATMFAYDSLLMPTRFWGETPPSRKRPRSKRSRWLVWRPPSSAVWVLSDSPKITTTRPKITRTRPKSTSGNRI